MALKKKKRAHEEVSSAWNAHVVEEAREDIAQKSANKKRARVRFIVKFVFYSWIPLVMILVFALLNIVQNTSAPTVGQSSQVSVTEARGKALSQLTVNEWLSSSPSPMPGAYLLSWDSVSDVSAIQEPATPQEAERTPDMDQHFMTLVDRYGSLYTATVTTQDTPSGPIVVGGVSVTPQAPRPDASDPAMAWPGVEQAQMTPGIEAAVDLWAGAMFSGDSQLLRQTVGDPDGEHLYIPMSMAEVRSADIEAISVAPDVVASGGSGDASTPATSVIARVNVRVLWAGQESSNDATLTPITYDVRIDRADTATPVVTSWGGGGSGPDLTTYSVAVSGYTDDALQSAVDRVQRARDEASEEGQ